MAVPPQWPRPVSPLHYEPLIPEPHHEIYLDESSSSEDEEQRSAKRRRIEQLGERYLRGYGLEIATARIRGPLGEGWKNPWKKNKRKGDQRHAKKGVDESAAKEIPETVHKVEAVLATNALKMNQRIQPQNQISEGLNSSKPLPPKPTSTLDPSTPQMLQGAIEEDPFKSSSALKSKDKVEYWLKKDQGVLRQRQVRDFDDPSSPTARFTAINVVRSGPAVPQTKALEDPTPLRKEEHGVPTPAANTREQHAKQVTEVVKPSPRSPRDDNSHQLNQYSRNSTTRQGISPKRNAVVKLKADRRPLQAVPPSTHLPEFEFRRVVRPSDDKTEQAPDAIDRPNSSRRSSPGKVHGHTNDQSGESGAIHRHASADRDGSAASRKENPITEGLRMSAREVGFKAPSPSDLARHDRAIKPGEILSLPNEGLGAQMRPPPPPSLTTETSNKTDTTTTNNYPSAQIVSNPQGLVTIGSLPSTKLDPDGGNKDCHQATDEDHVEDSILHMSTQAAVERAQQKFQADLKTPKPNTVQLQQKGDTDHVEERFEIDPDDVTNSSKLSPSYHTPEDLDTQEMLNAISPFVFSTTKKVPLKAPELPGTKPTTTTKVPSRKNKKRASFVLDTPDSDSTVQSSIRSSLKVKKPAAAETGGALSKETHQKAFDDSVNEFPDGSMKLDMSTSTENSANLRPSDAAKASSVSLHSLSSLLHGPGSKRHPAPPSPFPMTATSVEAKNTTLPTPTAPTTNQSLSSRLQQDAQPEAHAQYHHHRPNVSDGSDAKDPHVNGNGPEMTMESFDLEATMDDIGSFLQSWDAEKEASVVGKEEGTRSSLCGNGSAKRAWKKGRLSGASVRS